MGSGGRNPLRQNRHLPLRLRSLCRPSWNALPMYPNSHPPHLPQGIPNTSSLLSPSPQQMLTHMRSASSTEQSKDERENEHNGAGFLMSHIVMHSLQRGAALVLQELRPKFVIVYEPDTTFIRQLEVLSLCPRFFLSRVARYEYGTPLLRLLLGVQSRESGSASTSLFPHVRKFCGRTALSILSEKREGSL